MAFVLGLVAVCWLVGLGFHLNFEVLCFAEAFVLVLVPAVVAFGLDLDLAVQVCLGLDLVVVCYLVVYCLVAFALVLVVVLDLDLVAVYCLAV